MQKSLTCMTLNPRSMRNKLEKIETLLHRLYLVDIIAISETWLEPSEVNYFNINNYASIHVHRDKSGGCAALYIHNTWSFKILNKVQEEHSILTVEIKKGNINITVVALYNPNNNNTPQMIIDLENILSVYSGRKMLVTGDFNVNMLGSKDPYATPLADLLKSYGLYLCNRIFPTRVTKKTSSLLDHMYSNIYELNHVLGTIENDLSDHRILVTNISNSNSQRSTENNLVSNKENVHLIDYNKINLYFECELFNNESDNPEEHYQNLLLHINKALEYSTKVQKRPKSQSKRYKPVAPWINSSLLKTIQKRDAIFSKLKKHPDNVNLREEYKHIRNIVTQEKRKTKSEFYRQKFSKSLNNTKTFWKTVNEVISNTSKCSSPRDIQIREKGEIVPQKLIPEIFNKFFTSIGSQLTKSTDISNTKVQTQMSYSSFFLGPVTSFEVSKTITSLKFKHNITKDNITNKLLIKCKDQLSNHIANVINSTFSRGIVPSECKIARVIPVYKNGNPEEPTNYRPISILPAISKVIEKCVKRRLTEYLKTNRILYKYQYGFRESSSTQSAVIDIVINLEDALDRGLAAAGLFIDLRKAFDTVDHGILISKLDNLGIRGLPLRWFKSYLSERKQYVYVNGLYSDEQIVTRGVPQGSVLGPLLFLIYVNDISSYKLNGMPVLFADDMYISYTADSIGALQDKMQQDLNIIHNWLSINKLSINLNKTVYISFHRKTTVNVDHDINLQLQGQTIKRVTVTKYLGIYINQHLEWGDHIQYICKKVAPILGVLYRVRDLLPAALVKNIYHAYIQSQLKYMIILWGRSNKKVLHPLQILQNRALRILFKLPALHPNRDTYLISQLFPIEIQTKEAAILYMYKVVNNNMHHNISFNFKSEIHSHLTRHNLHIYSHSYNSKSFGTNGVKNYLVQLYNKNCTEHRQVETFNKLKKRIKETLWKEIENM